MHTQIQNEVKEIEDLENETLQAIYKRQNEVVINLYERVEQLFSKGSSYSRTLIANKFIFPISSFLEMNYAWGKEYLNLFPQQLKAEYYRQTGSSCI